VDKKPLIVISICAVVLLVMGSLSNVVGFQSVKSTISDSPLFNMRTQRATNQQQNIFTSQYLGMGKESILKFSIRDNRTVLIQKIIEKIQKMSKKEFNILQNLFISLYYKKNNNMNNDAAQLLSILQQFKSNETELKITLYNNINYSKNDPPTFYTVGCYFGHCYTYAYNPHCGRDFVIALLVVLLFLPELLILLFIGHLLTIDCVP
jgi:hypothetical protein